MSEASDVRRALRKLDDHEAQLRRLKNAMEEYGNVLAALISVQADHRFMLEDIFAILNVILDRLGPEGDIETALRCGEEVEKSPQLARRERKGSVPPSHDVAQK